MYRAVLDTSVLVAALRSRSGASNGLLRKVAVLELVPLVSPALFLEYEDVLKRPEQRSAHGMSVSDIDGFLAALASASEPVESHFRWRPQLRDPGDEMVLETAVNGRARALVTHNVRDFAPAKQFRLAVLTPADCLKELAS
ncbi:MAG: putative toxin-antitoxin system toxin component, PIN family [Caulobacter sp.]|jgi:putative PIN family toxin of toxin-antitoxin system|nr:putative toxin-antitoxin system toxin component, PIN family [Caulobacter sp.]